MAHLLLERRGKGLFERIRQRRAVGASAANLQILAPAIVLDEGCDDLVGCTI